MGSDETVPAGAPGPTLAVVAHEEAAAHLAMATTTVAAIGQRAEIAGRTLGGTAISSAWLHTDSTGEWLRSLCPAGEDVKPLL